jgi:hypothetical protein
VAEGARLESVCGGNSTAGSNPALSAISREPQTRRSHVSPAGRARLLDSDRWEPTLEPGSCASSASEPCQARKGAALRRTSTSAAGHLGSMVGSRHLDRSGTSRRQGVSPFPLPFPLPFPTTRNRRRAMRTPGGYATFIGGPRARSERGRAGETSVLPTRKDPALTEHPPKAVEDGLGGPSRAIGPRPTTRWSLDQPVDRSQPAPVVELAP